jgi:arginase
MENRARLIAVIDIIGASFDLCGPWVGSRLGPAAIRLANLRGTLESLGCEVADHGDIDGGNAASACEGLRNIDPLIQCIKRLRREVAKSLESGGLPLVLGGEHTLAMASLSAALERYGSELAVIWIDAHADINTPGSSLTGNLHGMPLAALAGLPSETTGRLDEDWRNLIEALGNGPRLKPERVAWYGLRDVDPAERDRLAGLAITMHDIDRHGVVSTVQRLDRWLTEIDARHLWISFDVDALDPILAPGTGTAVRGGLSYREAHLIAELIWEALNAGSCAYKLVGLDVVEVNPIRDTNNATALMAVEWIGSLFGKAILG